MRRSSSVATTGSSSTNRTCDAQCAARWHADTHARNVAKTWSISRSTKVTREFATTRTNNTHMRRRCWGSPKECASKVTRWPS
eukprot:2514102-Lingulodinium_polyedra.AAC.1